MLFEVLVRPLMVKSEREKTLSLQIQMGREFVVDMLQYVADQLVIAARLGLADMMLGVAEQKRKYDRRGGGRRAVKFVADIGIDALADGFTLHAYQQGEESPKLVGRARMAGIQRHEVLLVVIASDKHGLNEPCPDRIEIIS